MGFVSRPEIDINRRGDLYDSTLWYHNVNERTNADLVLKCKAKFYAVDPGALPAGLDRGGRDLPASMIAWGGAFASWKTSLIRMVDRFWGNRMWLVPTSNMGLDWRGRDGTVYRPAVRCGFRLIEVTSGENIKVACVRLPTGGFTTSFWQPSQKTLWLDSEDTVMTNKGGGNQQRPALHEFGHAMGLPHVNQASWACVWDGVTSGDGGNAAVCYGRGTFQRDDIMGAGERLDTWHARLWRGRIGDHLSGLASWTSFNVTLNRPAPAVVSRPAPTRRHPHGLDAGVPLPAGVRGR